MLFPIGTDRPIRRRAHVCRGLIALNIAIFVMTEVVRVTDPALKGQIFALFRVGGPDPHAWGLLTSAFLHGGWLHVLGNMLFLWVFGPPIEDRLGHWWFMLFYATAAVVSGAVHAGFESAPAIGASGAVAGVTGVFLVMFPRTHIRCFSLLIVIGLVAVPAWWFIGLAVAIDLLSQGLGQANGIANLAHIGGYVYGFLVAFTLLQLKLVPREPYDLFTMARQAQRRRAFRTAAAEASSKPAPPKPKTKTDEASEALATARAAVSRAIANGELDEAIDAYRALESEHAQIDGAAVLTRDVQYEVANHLVRLGDHQGAASAYERFLLAYPDDRESSEVRLMLGRLKGRYLADREGAVDLLRQVVGETDDDQVRAIAEEELSLITE